MTLFDKIKQRIWHFIYKFFPTFQKAFLKLHLIWHKDKRQRFHIGWLTSGKTLEELKNHLHTKWNFGNHFIAWRDSEQVLSWRKLEDFNHQYHLRVFYDGEVRGHYEYTPEGHPLKHFSEKGEDFHRKEFLKFLGDFVTQKKHTSQLEIDPDAYNPNSEISIESSK